MDTVGSWLKLVHAHWPPAEASSWDAVGLQVGGSSWPVARVLVALDVTADVLDEAAAQPHTMVLAHHPLLLKPLARLTPDTPAGALALRAATSRIAVAAAHTNLDVAQDGTGTSDPVATTLALENLRPLTTELGDASHVKLVVLVPVAHTDDVLDAIVEAGGAAQGVYERVSFRAGGLGTFTPLPGAKPYVGEVGQPHLEEEDRLELLVAKRQVGPVVRAMLSAHPYEEVAYDLVPLLDGATVGFGRVGTLPVPRTLQDVADLLRHRMPSPHLRIAGDRSRMVQTVATVGGSGMSLAGAALAAGADVYVTGDCKHHDVLDVIAQGMAVIDAGHHATENAALPAWISALTADAKAQGLSASVLASQVDTDPWS
ncbi:MAG: dinuclear metal center YbgI/SA1388 family protein [Nitriliruptoraceae bacterium]